MNRKTMVSFKTNMRHQNLKRVRKGMLAPLVVFLFCARRLANRAAGKREFLTGRPCRHRGLPPPPPPPSPSNTMDIRRLTLYAPMMPSSFRFVLSAPSFPAWLFGACAAASATGNTGNIAPKTENLLGKCRAPNAFRSPRGNQGVFYRGETGRQMSVHQVRFSSVREPTTTYGRIAEELLKNCVGRRPLCWV